MKRTYTELKKNIQKWMNEEGFTSYTCILSTNIKEHATSSNFTITSIETKKLEVFHCQVYFNKKFYKFSLTGFQFIEEEIRKLKNIMLSLENNDYFEEKSIFHSTVEYKQENYKMTLQELQDKIIEIHRIIKSQNDNVKDDLISLCSFTDNEFVFNGAGYESFSVITYSQAYISLLLSYYLRGSNNILQETEWDYFLVKKDTNFGVIINKILDIMKLYTNKVTITDDQYLIAFHSKVSSYLVDMVLEASQGDSIYYDKSFVKLEDLNKQIFSSKINIKENPMLKNSIYNALVDHNGIPIQEKYIIEQGVVKNLLLNVEYGIKLKKQTTGNGWLGAIGYTNVYLEPGDLSYEDLIKNMYNGIIVMDILGNGFHVHNGEISVSIKGFRVENGKITGTVNGTINGHIKEMLKENVFIANDIEYDDKISSPSIQVNFMKFAPAVDDV